MPRVTIAIPCYNHGTYLQETLASVAAQTLDDYEIIIVNDGSTDATTLEILSTLDNPKIRVITTANHGVSAARNRAIADAAGEYILPLDADDKIAPTYLEQAVAILDNQHNVAAVYSDQILFGERDDVLSLPDYDPRRLLVQNLMHVSAVFRKADWERVGGYCESMTSGWEDWEFWIAISRLGSEVVKLEEPLFYYRIRSSSRDNTMGLKAKLTMFGLIFWQHKTLYLRNLAYVIKELSVYIFSKPPNPS